MLKCDDVFQFCAVNALLPMITKTKLSVSTAYLKGWRRGGGLVCLQCRWQVQQIHSARRLSLARAFVLCCWAHPRSRELARPRGASRPAGSCTCGSSVKTGIPPVLTYCTYHVDLESRSSYVVVESNSRIYIVSFYSISIPSLSGIRSN